MSLLSCPGQHLPELQKNTVFILLGFSPELGGQHAPDYPPSYSFKISLGLFRTKAVSISNFSSNCFSLSNCSNSANNFEIVLLLVKTIVSELYNSTVSIKA